MHGTSGADQPALQTSASPERECRSCCGIGHLDASGPGLAVSDAVIIDGHRAQVCADCEGTGLAPTCRCGAVLTADDLSLGECEPCWEQRRSIANHPTASFVAGMARSL